MLRENVSNLFEKWQINRRFLLLDLALLAAALLLIFTPGKVLFFHVVYILLTFGAFYWKFRPFALRAIFWVAVSSVAVVLAVLNHQTQVEEIIEIPLLSSILVLVFAIAEQRSSAQEALRKNNQELERRVLERTAELTQVNAELTAEIKKHKQTAETLAESEERYRRLVELSFETVAIHSNGKIVHLNSPGAELLGAARVEELIGMPILNFIHPDSLEMVQWRVQQIEAGNGVPLLEEKFVRLDGSSVDVEVASVPITYQGRPAVQTVIRDITPRKRAEAEREYLLATEREQRLLAETLGEVFLALTAQTSHETVLDEILRQIQRLVSHSAANIVLLKNKTLQIARYQGYQAFSSNALVLSLEQSLSDFPLDAEVVNSRRPLVIPDTHQNPRWVTAPESAWIRSFLVVPICLGDRVLGLLRLDSDTPGQFSTQDAKRLEPLANAAAIALENARLYDQARQEIVERVQAERELRQIATKNQAILNAIPDSMFHLSRDGRLLDYKIYDAASPQKMLSEIGIKSLRNTLHLWPDLVDLTLQHIARTLDTGEIQIFECQLPLPSGPRDYEARLVVNGADEVLAIVRDITERKARNAALEKERARIARDLHDSLGQSLGYLHLKLDELTSTNLLPELEPIRPQLIQMRNVANEAYELVRNMLAAARPANSTDLATALLAQAKSAGNRAGFRINLTSEGQPRPLSPIAQHQILYMFQEALSNVVKHAKAQHVDLKLVWAEDMLTISLADDGCGFDTSTLQTDGHFGLTIMQERAEEINGFLSINSSPNAGAELTLRLPLTPMSQPLVLENLAF